MVKTIGNPLSWTGRILGLASAHARDAIREVAGADAENTVPEVQDLTLRDVGAALRAGIEDFAYFRTDVLMLVFVYPVIGLLLVWFAFDMSLVPLIFPMVAGFALIGPVAAVGLYELSRRRERGEETHWYQALSILRSPAFAPILTMGLYLLALFVLWMFAARWIYEATMGGMVPASISTFLTDVFTTSAGWNLIIAGMAVGFVFAVLVLAVSVVSFPMMVDRHVGLVTAVTTSLAVTRRNPAAICGWGAIVAVLLVLGSIPAMIGLVLVLPVLGHGTWHLYRRAVHYRKPE